MEMSLNCLKEGQRGKITKLTMAGGMRGRLQDLGLIEGTSICCLRKSPAGDPVIYRARGTMLALRNADSSQILVEEVP